jgi:hypothetical protein
MKLNKSGAEKLNLCSDYSAVSLSKYVKLLLPNSWDSQCGLIIRSLSQNYLPTRRNLHFGIHNLTGCDDLFLAYISDL